MSRVLHSPEIIDEESGPDEIVEPFHNWAGKEQHLLPLFNVDHLPLDVESLVNVLPTGKI